MASVTENLPQLESGQIKPSGVMLMYISCLPAPWVGLLVTKVKYDSKKLSTNLYFTVRLIDMEMTPLVRKKTFVKMLAFFPF